MFGLYDRIPKILEKAAKLFGAIQEIVRQIEVKALRRLRKPFRFKFLNGFSYYET